MNSRGSNATSGWTVVGLIFAWRFSIFILAHIGFEVEWLRISNENLMHMKQTLSPIRLFAYSPMHFVSVALLFSIYIRPASSIMQSFAGNMLALIGRRSLEMYSLSVVLSTAASIFVVAQNPSVGMHLIVDCALATMVGLTAIIVTGAKRLSAKTLVK